MLSFVATSLTILLVTALLYLKWCFTYWKKRGVYTPPPSIPFGNGADMILGKACFGAKTKQLYDEFKAKGLPYGGFYIFGMPMLMPVDLQLLRDVLVKDFQHFTDRIGYVNEEWDPLSGHLFQQKGAKWKILRQKLTSSFSPGKLKVMFPTFVNAANNLPIPINKLIEKGEPIAIKEIYARYTTDIIASVAFGVDCNSLLGSNDEFRKHGKRLIETAANSNKLFLNLTMPRLLNFLGIKVAEKDVEDFIFKIVTETASFRDKNKFERKDMMQLLLDMRNQDLKLKSAVDKNNSDVKIDYSQDGLSINEIAAQTFVFFAAGYETSSTALTFLTYEFSTHPELQEKARKEVNEVLDKHNGQVTYEILGEMPYLEMCFQESLRMYPPVPSVPRVCTMTYKIPNTDLVIQKGTSLVIPIIGVQNDPEYFPEPNKFNPERFSPENKNKIPPFAHMPFGEGPRICIGLRMAMLQAKIAMIKMLREFRFKLNPKTELPITFDPRSFPLSAKGGIWIDVEKV